MARDIKFRAFIKGLNIITPVQRINFDCSTVEVRLDDGDFWEYDFKEVELMEFTGDHDRNGKPIYEGDIVKGRDSFLAGFSKEDNISGVVAFQDCSFVIKNDCVTHYRWMDYEVEVVGNKLENPELLTDMED